MLPPALLEFTLARLIHRGSILGSEVVTARTWPRRIGVRAMQQAVLVSDTSPVTLYPHLKGKQTLVKPSQGSKKPKGVGHLKVREEKAAAERPRSELAHRVDALLKVAQREEETVDHPTFSEEELLSLYEDILAGPETEMERQQEDLTPEQRSLEDVEMVEAVYERLREQTLEEYLDPQSSKAPWLQHAYHRRILDQVGKLMDLVLRGDDAPLIPIVTLSIQEWNALIRICIRKNDLESAERSLRLMKRTGVTLPEESINEVVKFYADKGDVSETERILNSFVLGAPSDRQQHLHICSHLRASPDAMPTSALAILHAYEEQLNMPAQKTYTSLVKHMLSVKDSTSNAQAWDLFYHMRYVAHPVPDAFLYTTMIRACASSFFTIRASEPERALDLWTEMTIDNNIAPTVASYNAVILTCARTGDKKYVHEAFRLAKEMLDSHRDAHGELLYVPDQHTFLALLEGAKRIGDLSRTRWILAQISRVSVEEPSLGVTIDEEVMMHVFHAYAAYDPPFKRGIALLLEESQTAPASNDTSTTHQESSDVAVTPNTPTFAHVAPQSRAEVIAEAELLFGRILEDGGFSFDPTISFSNVKLSTRLLNSYLSVHYKHGTLEAARKLFLDLFVDLDMGRNARTFREALERCMYSHQKERQFALEFGGEVFKMWQEYDASGGVADARTVEKIHVAYIRLLALTKDLDAALDQLRAFVAKYPPSALRHQPAKPGLRSTKTVLTGSRPLVRMASAAEVPDSHVPPFVLFRDIDVLHNRLVASGDVNGIAYVKYVCKAYEWALRVRRDEALKAKPVDAESTALIDLEED
ncbi:uncharacterized protein BT62DRAFT_948401 [Guyanagaster necrorhizus]|uniref:Pentatricopeptide repeat protein n=1 Tax=Guyanagaster necrorhizus TaxID=856835 RepID=A0A9P7VVH2_9AGAR|nr:uncharacterized protein BT62DRAFT_948401 [Guyanagaster necrorhizus MCA 3950]KAG7447353.1 hypothetical protein BT62DRAFT_948401 [Guyanagaster necrorhizus MCA 3950]